MQFCRILLAGLCLGLSQAQETVLGVYIFSRHGDRTAKSTPPVNLTDLGYQEVYTSGQYFRERYVASDATFKVQGMNTDLVEQSQITVSAPTDTALQNSAQGFLQGLYPPVGSILGSNTLRNGTVVQSPLNGYQLIPVDVVSSGSDSESSAWLQGQTNCANAESSSNDFFSSNEYLALLDQTQAFYKGVFPMINQTFTSSQTSYKNAYTIFDLLNVASIHNSTFQSSYLLTPETMFQLRTLADSHEFGLAYNSSEPIRAIAGSVLAGQIVTALNTTITSKGSAKMNIQFGAYGSMFSYFGLANLTAASPDFYGIADYASTLIWELVTNASTETFPSADDISVRFLFHNGTTSNISEPTAYPLFGQTETVLPWSDFVSNMNKFAINSQAEWCKACGNSTGTCSTQALGGDDSSGTGVDSSSSDSSSSNGGISKAVAGVIGAMVTLGVILGAALLILLVGGLRVVSKKRLNGAAVAGGKGDEFTTNT